MRITLAFVVFSMGSPAHAHLPAQFRPNELVLRPTFGPFFLSDGSGTEYIMDRNINERDSAFTVRRLRGSDASGSAMTYHFPLADDAEILAAAMDRRQGLVVVGRQHRVRLIARWHRPSDPDWTVNVTAPTAVEPVGSANAVVIDRSGTIYVAGQHIDITGEPRWTVEAFSSSGRSLWNVGPPGIAVGPSTACAIAVAPTRGVVVAGNGSTPSDALLVMYEYSGVIRWQRPLPVVDGWHTSVRGIAIDQAGRICVAGTRRCFGKSQGLLMLYAQDGTAIWTVTTEGDQGGNVEFNSVSMARDGEILAGGMDGDSAAVTGRQSLCVLLGTDGWVIRRWVEGTRFRESWVTATCLDDVGEAYGGSELIGQHDSVVPWYRGTLRTDPGWVKAKAGRQSAVRPANPVLAMFDLDSRNSAPGEAALVTDALRLGLNGRPGITLVERSKVRDLLAEQRFEHGSCTETECRVRIGKLLNAHWLLMGSYGTLGREQLVVVHVLDVATGAILGSCTASFASTSDVFNGAKSLGAKVLESVARSFELAKAP